MCVRSKRAWQRFLLPLNISYSLAQAMEYLYYGALSGLPVLLLQPGSLEEDKAELKDQGTENIPSFCWA